MIYFPYLARSKGRREGGRRIMGRELRRVPPDWEHPRDEQGQYIPLYNKCYEDAVEDWEAQEHLWNRGLHPYLQHPKAAGLSWEEWYGKRPNPRRYREECWDEDVATSYQLYETTTEGTPRSPVLHDLDAVRAWLLADGFTESTVEELIRTCGMPGITIPLAVIRDYIRPVDPADK
jgi:hypothetical protein